MDDGIAALRANYPTTGEWAYFDVAARGLVSRGVRRAIDGFLDRCMLDGGDKPEMFRIVEETRQRFAGLIGASADEIGLTKNVSEGINAFATALPWRAGDNVVMCRALEHPANIFPWQNLVQLRDIQVKAVPAEDGRIPVARMAEAIDGRTRVMTLSTVSFAPGFRAAVAELGAICRSRGVLLVVDAAQSIGVLHTDVAAMGVDALAASTQKGLLALYGFGFLYVRRAVADTLAPAYLSRPGVKVDAAHEASAGDGTDYCLADGARRFDVGNFNFLGAVAVHAALGEIAAVGTRAIEAHASGLAQRLAEGLIGAGLPVFGGIDCPDRGHIVGVGDGLTDEHDSTGDGLLLDLHERLTAERVRHTIRRGMLRLSLHLYNNRDDVDRTVAIARDFMAKTNRRPAVSVA